MKLILAPSMGRNESDLAGISPAGRSSLNPAESCLNPAKVSLNPAPHRSVRWNRRAFECLVEWYHSVSSRVGSEGFRSKTHACASPFLQDSHYGSRCVPSLNPTLPCLNPAAKRRKFSPARFRTSFRPMERSRAACADFRKRYTRR